MLIDTSALMAILFSEPDARVYSDAIMRASRRCMAAPSYLECAMVMTSRHGSAGVDRLNEAIATASIELLALDASCARAAASAFVIYGKGRHPAKLNFGDCMSYAMAKTEIMPLLFKGGDFRLTDIDAAV